MLWEERKVSITWYDWFNARILDLKNYKRCVDLEWWQLHENYMYVNCSWRNKYESNPRSYEYYWSSHENMACKISGLCGIWTHDCYNTRSWVQILYLPELFSVLIFTTSSVVFITARITFIFLYVELVIKKICCYTLCPSVVNLTALIFLAKLKVVTWSIKKQTHDDDGTEKMKLLLSKDDLFAGKRVLVICDCWI